MDDLDRLDIQAALDGDDEGYRRLVERHQAAVARLMWRFSRDRTTVEELVQEVLVQAYYSLPRYRHEGPLAAWLSRIATRVGYRFWRQQARSVAHYQIADIDLPDEPIADEGIEPSLAGQIVEALLSQLSQADRLILTLMYFDKCSTEEIGRRMGWNRAVVKMRAHRARRKLKVLAERQGLWEKLGWMHSD